MKTYLTQGLFTVAALAALVMALVYNSEQIQAQMNKPLPAAEQAPAAPDVTVLQVQPGRYQAQITAYGNAKSEFEMTLTSEVAGRVTMLAENFASGQQFATGDTLLEIDNTDYEEALANARSELEEANLALLEEQREGAQALKEWKASGIKGNPASPLVLRKPQLQAAEAAVAKAEAALSSAQHQLERTTITAPFDALVVSREVNPGSYLQSGGSVATLYSTSTVEIAFSLSTRDWSNLPDAAQLLNGNWQVTLTNVENDTCWQGVVSRIEQHLDDGTRQRSLIVTVANPLAQEPPLYPGTFVTATINGKALENLWRLPSSALSQGGEIWYVTADNTLANFTAETLFSVDDDIFIEAPAAMPTAAVVVYPLSGYLAGMRVNPVTEG